MKPGLKTDSFVIQNVGRCMIVHGRYWRVMDDHNMKMSRSEKTCPCALQGIAFTIWCEIRFYGGPELEYKQLMNWLQLKQSRPFIHQYFQSDLVYIQLECVTLYKQPQMQ